MGRYDYLDEDKFGFPAGGALAQKAGKGTSGVIERLIQHLEQGDRKGYVLPIISNSIRIEWILDRDFNSELGPGDEFQGKVPDLANLEQELAQYWADSFKYPYGIPSRPKSLRKLRDEYPGILENGRSGDEKVDQLTQVVRDLLDIENHLREVAQYNHLARVAQYRQLVPKDSDLVATNPNYLKRLASEDYLSFLKRTLLYGIAKEDPMPDSLRDELKDLIEEGAYSFSDLAQDLGYPRFNGKYPDILRMLAQLNAKIFITTSYYDFLERLLQAEGKNPITQICFLKGEPGNILPEHRTIYKGFEPTVNNPVVYHLYGFEEYPSSLVMSESDYVDFLVAMARDTNSKKPIVPLYIRAALAESALLLLGYRLPDWDFRVLFRSLLRQETKRNFSVALQLDPEHQDSQETARAEAYLRQYFSTVEFELVLSSTVDFVQNLYQEWKKRKSGNGRH